MVAQERREGLAPAHHRPEEAGVAVVDETGRKGQGHHVIDVGGRGHVTAGEDFEYSN